MSQGAITMLTDHGIGVIIGEARVDAVFHGGRAQ